MAMDYFIPKRQSDKEESLAKFVRRRLGNEALEKIAEPLVAGIHAGTPETMGLKSTFPRFLQIEKEHEVSSVACWQGERWPFNGKKKKDLRGQCF